MHKIENIPQQKGLNPVNPKILEILILTTASQSS